MDQCYLAVQVNGGFFHPADDQPTVINDRYTEVINTPDLAVKRLLSVDVPTVLDLGMFNPRLIVVTNRSGEGLTNFPDEETAAKMAKKVLLIGINGPPGLRLLPADPGKRPGGSQLLWLGPGCQITLAPEETGLLVLVRLLIVPGA